MVYVSLTAAGILLGKSAWSISVTTDRGLPIPVIHFTHPKKIILGSLSQWGWASWSRSVVRVIVGDSIRTDWSVHDKTFCDAHDDWDYLPPLQPQCRRQLRNTSQCCWPFRLFSHRRWRLRCEVFLDNGSFCGKHDCWPVTLTLGGSIDSSSWSYYPQIFGAEWRTCECTVDIIAWIWTSLNLILLDTWRRYWARKTWGSCNSEIHQLDRRQICQSNSSRHAQSWA